MSEYLQALESAITDVGYWSWWTDNLPATFQVEFGGVQLFNPPSGEGKPPSSQIAIRFRKPRLVYFLSFATNVVKDWPYQLQRDELNPPNLDRDSFTFTEVSLCEQLIRDAVSITALVGEPGVTTLPTSDEAFIGFSAGPYGLVVAAESFGVFNFQGEISIQEVQLGIQKWREYWREYWRRKDTPKPMPHDFTCEVTIPGANDEEE